MNALFRSTRGTSGSEYLTLGATIAMVGIGGFVAFGGAMNDSIVGQTSSGASLPSDGVARSAAAALSDDQEKAVRDRLEDEGVLEELEAAGVDIETLDEHPNLAQYLADRGVTDDVILSVYDALGEELPGFDPGGSGLNTPNPNATPNQDVTLNADDVDFSDLQGQLAELGEGHILGDQVMPDSTQFEAQCGHLAGQARATCLASAAGLEQNAPEDFSPTFGAGLWHDFAGSFMDNLKGIASSTWNAITHPVDTFKGLAYMVTHPGAAWDGLKAYWGDNCGAGVLTGEC
ncbi:MAG: hypothetical protein KC416_13880, partial [Myxococcales bacterium]|nr:hypothetical protein [Myxococcales bacterium]